MTNWFQTDECLEFYRSLSFIEPFEVKIEREGETKGRIVGYIQKDGGKLKQFFSRRAIINGGPALADDITAAELTQLLIDCRKVLKGKVIYAETRNFEDYSKYREVLKTCGWGYEPHYNFHVDTTSLDLAESRLSKSIKRYIKTSLRDGAITKEASSIEEVKELYEILITLYRDRVKTPLFPFEFFEKLFSSSFGKILVAKYQDRVIGGTVCVHGGGIVYEWFICGKDGLFKTIYPSMLATYSGIEYAAEHGSYRFDMMGAGAPGDGGYGVRDFKAKFGGELVEHGRFKLILNKPLYTIGKLGVKLIKKL